MILARMCTNGSKFLFLIKLINLIHVNYCNNKFINLSKEMEHVKFTVL